jgi:hypothetical protein
LQAIGCFCIGTNQVDLSAATKKGIAVFNAPYSNTRSVAELVIASSIMLIRKIPDKNKAAHEGIWMKDAKGSHEKAGVRNYGLGWRMNVYPDGKKVIYHNGWWHGNNNVFIRMIQDSVTIIVLGNKYNPLIYQSKEIANVFDSGLKIEDE